jgi:excisionase family DNA binding protein
MALLKRYTVKEAAEALKKSEDTILRLCRSGALRAKNIRPNSERACWQIFEDDLNAFGADNDNRAPAPKLTRHRTHRRADFCGTNPIQEAEDLLAEAMRTAKTKGRR